MDENRKFSDYAEVWVNARRARNVYLSLSFALITAAFGQSWKSPQQQAVSDQATSPPAAKAAEPMHTKRANAF